jgi:hypothetical protein
VEGVNSSTMKPKRRVICEKEKNQIDRLYLENGNDPVHCFKSENGGKR